MSLFVEDVIVYRDNPKESTKKPFRISDFSKVAKYVNIYFKNNISIY